MIKPPNDIKSRLDSLFEELRQHDQNDPECEELRGRIINFLRSVACGPAGFAREQKVEGRRKA